MSDRGSEPTEPIDLPPTPTVTLRRSSTAVGNAIAILLVLAIGGAMAGGAIRNLVPPLRGGNAASPTPAATAEPSATFTPRPLPSFTPTPSPSPSPSPTRTASPTPRVTPSPVLTPRTPTPTPPRTPTPTPTR